MLISKKKKFIFLHIYKTAGTSISKYLEKYDDSYNLYYFIKSIALRNTTLHNKLCPKHVNALTIKRTVGDKIYNDYFKFCFVRNPWDWQVSLYHFVLRDKTNQHFNIISSFKTFDEYIEWRVNEEKRLQKSFIIDDEGNVIVDFIGRYELLNQDFEKICEKINIKPIKLPHLNKSERDNYRSYYNDHTRQLVQKAYIEDIEFFNYEF